MHVTEAVMPCALVGYEVGRKSAQHVARWSLQFLLTHDELPPAGAMTDVCRKAMDKAESGGYVAAAVAGKLVECDKHVDQCNQCTLLMSSSKLFGCRKH